MPRGKVVKKVKKLKDIENSKPGQKKTKTYVKRSISINVSDKQIGEGETRHFCTSYRFNCLLAFLFVAGIITTLFNPEIHGIEKPPCPPKQGLFNGKCVTYCSIQNFVDGLTGETFEEALSKCLFSCPDGVIMYGKCVKKDINEFFDDGAKSLANQNTTG